MGNVAASRILTLAIAVSVVVLDRWSKWLIETRLQLYDTVTVIPGFFNIVRSENPGVAFGILADGSSSGRTAILVALSLAAIAVLAVMLWKIGRQDRWTTIGISLIFGGAIGNVYDRIIAGKVTDFLDFYAGNWHWYTFNLADSAICIGAGLLALSSLLIKPHREANA
jgi:signal peptidase II